MINTKLLINFNKIEENYILPLGLDSIPKLSGAENQAVTDF
jgi:hypothetical protein